MNLDPSASIVLAGATAIVITGLALRPRLRRSPTQQHSRSFAAPLVRFIGSHREVHLQNQPAPPEDVAEWCDRLARRMRSGSTLREALMSTTPTGLGLRKVTANLRLALERGQPITTALETARGVESRQWMAGPHADLSFTVISIAARLGGSNAKALDRTAGSLRLRAADQQERSSQAAQARLSAHVLTVVPLAMLILLVSIDADVRHAVQAPIGASSVVVGLVLNGLGWKWMRHIIGGRQ